MKADWHKGLRLLAGVLAVGFVLNYLWEMIQMPAFADGSGQPFRPGWEFASRHCFIPTFGDMFIIGLTFILGWLIQRRPDWIRQLGWREMLLVTLPLVLLAITIELVNVYVLERWTYSDLMPVVPVVGVGLFPMVQLALLTLLTFGLVGRFVDRRCRHMFT